MDTCSPCVDAIAVAGQLGRLDAVSLLLAAVGVVLVLGGVFAFINFRSIARSQAEKEANAVAKEVSERIANEYMQRELPNVIKSYREMMEGENVLNEQANRFADSQEGREGKDDR
ncbi:MAG: hypothetical protein OXD36_09385 [Rhodobacter sp.]|nr:hypothetical protein [Rhodobacter sp.]